MPSALQIQVLVPLTLSQSVPCSSPAATASVRVPATPGVGRGRAALHIVKPPTQPSSREANMRHSCIPDGCRTCGWCNPPEPRNPPRTHGCSHRSSSPGLASTGSTSPVRNNRRQRIKIQSEAWPPTSCIRSGDPGQQSASLELGGYPARVSFI